MAEVDPSPEGCSTPAMIRKLRNGFLSCLLGSPPDDGAILRGQPVIYTQVCSLSFHFVWGGVCAFFFFFFLFQLDTQDSMTDAVGNTSQGPGALINSLFFFFSVLGCGVRREGFV